MAMKHLITLGAMFAVCCINLNLATGQINLPGPSFKPKSVESVDSTRPLATPGIFNYDAQMFAPLEFPSNKQLGPRDGFFATYDRLYTSFSHPGNGSTLAASPVGNSYIWGTRYNIGWMSEADEGWSVEFSQMDGSFFTAGQDVLVSNPMQVTTKFANFEINRVFRQALKQGGWVEPYIGMRYVYLSDSTIEDTTTTVGTSTIENRFKQNVRNSSVGFQVGGRFARRAGRWRHAADFALATNYNQQTFFATDISQDISQTPVAFFLTEKYQADSSFVPIIDISYELAYNLTRDFGLRGGVQMMYMWDGIARANTLSTADNPNSDFSITTDTGGLFDGRTLAAGFSFGFEWRR